MTPTPDELTQRQRAMWSAGDYPDKPSGAWAAARADLVELYDRFNDADDGSLSAQPEYLLTVVRK